MNIKRTFASDIQQAIRKVREEQGPDAVILGNRKVEGGVEIISAVDYDETLFANAAAREPREAPRREAEPSGFVQHLDRLLERTESHVEESLQPQHTGRASGGAQAGRAEIVWSQDPLLREMRGELASLRKLFEDQLTVLEWNRLSKRHPLRVGLLGRLDDLGLDPQLAGELADLAQIQDEPERAWRHAIGQLARRIPIADAEVVDRGGVVAVVGPTGVGKTTTVAKLAARFVMQHGARHLALVTTDNFRIGAQEQLQSFARILGVPLHTTDSGAELAGLLRGLKDKKLVLIDTAGMGQRDLNLSRQFAALSASAESIRCYLTLSANAQLAVLDEVIQAFRKVDLAGAVITKLDEAASLGAVLSASVRHQLPLAYLGTGQRVPEDIQPARADHLVSVAVPLGRRYADAAAVDTLANRHLGTLNAHG